MTTLTEFLQDMLELLEIEEYMKKTKQKGNKNDT